MLKNEKINITTFLLAWVSDHKGTPHAYFEYSSERLCCRQGIIKVSVVKFGHRVVVYSDYLHGDEPCTKEELLLVAASYIEGKYDTVNIDLRN